MIAFFSLIQADLASQPPADTGFPFQPKRDLAVEENVWCQPAACQSVRRRRLGTKSLARDGPYDNSYRGSGCYREKERVK